MRASENRLRAFCRLGDQIERICEAVSPDAEQVIQRSLQENQWFTRENQLRALGAIRTWLVREKLEQWLAPYPQRQDQQPFRVAVIMAGNIPMVNFHDFLSVLITGNSFIGKLSSQDRHWLPYLAELLAKEDPELQSAIRFTDGLLKDFDAVIATGSDNSSRYFEYYFGKYPHIIRRNRSSIAILTGQESKEELSRLGDDIFSYFGLGCRNVSKLLIPEGYDHTEFMEAIEPYRAIADHNKYRNNYDYRKAIYLVNSEKFLDNDFLAVKPGSEVASPIGVVHTETYRDTVEIPEYVNAHSDKLQCVVGRDIPGIRTVPFGGTQEPGLTDYPDGVDIIQFLLDLRPAV